MIMMKPRAFYAVSAAVLFAAEVCIALFARDNFVRPYLGDVLVVMLIHCAARAVSPVKPRLLPLYVFLLGCLAELAQYFDLLGLLGLSHIAWLRVAAGGTFDWGDILCYGVGCAVVALLEYRCKTRTSPRKTTRA